ncbi:MAG: zinc-ribbon domain-containing protein [Sphingomonadales bacterium]|nr:zinc-ribbon domain-containing protein [Sphingomonadales bacterium]
MIIACPACATRYVVPDSAIGVDGRTVRCAKCRHSWFQDGPALSPPITATVAPPPPPPPPPPPAAAPEPVEPGSAWSSSDEAAVATAEPEAPVAVAESRPFEPETPAPAAEAPAAEVPVEDDDVERVAAPPFGYGEGTVEAPAWSPASTTYTYDSDTSSFAHEPPFRPRRNPARMWTIAAVLFATVAMGVIGATAWWGLPDWMPFSHPLFAEAQPGLKLDFPAKQQDRHQLPDGTWYFGASGTVTNTSEVSRSVPAVLIVLRDARNRVVYNAEVQSPKRVLAPGESVSINEALVQVPKAAVKAEFGWKPG